MKLTNTAGLAALLLACPLAATAVHGADYDVHYNNTPDASGKVASSGYQETPTGLWDNVYIGHAENTEEYVKALESSNNVGILGKGFTAKEDVWGGNANVRMHDREDPSYGYYGGPSYANTNTLVLKEGAFASRVTGGGSGGYRTVEACQNTVTFETGVTGDFTGVYGGYAVLQGVHEGGDTLSASGNTVTIKEGFDGTIDTIYVGFAGQKYANNIPDVDTISYTASDNKLYIFNPAKAEFEEIHIGGMSSTLYYSDAGQVYAANNNYGELILNENTELGTVDSAFVHVLGRGPNDVSSLSVEACGNSLHVTGGESYNLGAVDVTLEAALDDGGFNTTVTANDNTLVLTDAYVLGSCTGAYIGGYCSDTSLLEATGNTVILTSNTYFKHTEIGYSIPRAS